MKCAICEKEFRKGELSTWRESWSQAGGYGGIPPAAIAHPACNKKEQRALKRGKIQLSDLWRKVTAVE